VDRDRRGVWREWKEEGGTSASVELYPFPPPPPTSGTSSSQYSTYNLFWESDSTPLHAPFRFYPDSDSAPSLTSHLRGARQWDLSNYSALHLPSFS